jgi:hypothetical protein
MKILRKNDEFKKMPDKSLDDIFRINRLLKEGWNYCSRQVYKDFHKTEEVEPSKPKEKREKKKSIEK